MDQREQPELKTMEASETQQNWSTVLDAVSQRKMRVVIEEHGVPVAAMISPKDLDRFSRMEAERAERFSMLDRMREAFKDVSPEQLEHDVARVIAEVRAQKRKQQSRSVRTS